jgi:tetratricopeptide (TPR) repeat protein
MLKVISSLTFVCLLAFTVSAQTRRSRFFCGYGEGNQGAELCAKIQASTFTSNEVAERAVDKVLRPLGLKRNFVLISCPNINNAAAVTYGDGVRYIIYDDAFMREIDRNSSTDWASLVILAHELGHHLQGHTSRLVNFPPSMEELRRSRANELEADEFAGFVMYKMGASLAQAQSALSILTDVTNEEVSTHPKLWRRIEAIKTGYRDAEGQQPLANIDRAPSAEAFYMTGYNAHERKNYREAIDNYTVVIGLNPNFAEAYGSRGVAKYESKDYRGAIADCTEAIRLKPDFPEAYSGRGAAKHGLGDYRGAIADHNEAIRLKPDSPEAYGSRGATKHMLGDYRGAIADHTEAIRLKPDAAINYYNRGNTRHTGNKDYQGAITDYTEAIRLNPDFAAAYGSRGAAKHEMRDYRGAIADHTEAIRLSPDAAINYYNRGNTRLFGNKDYQGAIVDCTEAIRLKPDFPEAYGGRGAAKHGLGDYRGAIADHTEAIRLSPDAAINYYNRGNARYEDGPDYRGAIADHNEAIRLNPDFAEAYSSRGAAKSMSGDATGACNDYRKACQMGLSAACGAAGSCKQ